jgi:transitional endoplasmic reticulum ATPase
MTQAQTTKAIMAHLAALGGQMEGDDNIGHHDSNQILIPNGWSKARAAKLMVKLAQDDEEVTGVNRTFDYLPLDGARAVKNVLKRQFGSVLTQGTQSMWGATPPQLTEITTGPHKSDRESVPTGNVMLPTFGDQAYIELGSRRTLEMGTVFSIQGYCKKADEGAMLGLFRMIEEELDSNSIYKGRAITAREVPTFVDVSDIDPADVVYTPEVMEDAAVYVWSNIWYPQQLREIGELGKRLTVVHGKYGTGKTLMAYLTAWYCEQARLDPNQEDVTFIMVEAGQDNWRTAFQLARIYGRCIIFIEDVDTLIDTNDPQQVSLLLDLLDGLRAKGLDTSMVFTTNHIDRIHKGALRFGRTDGLIEIGNMDRAGLERLTRRVIANLAADIDFDAVFAACEGFTPSSVKEVLRRSLRRNLYQNQGMITQIGQAALIHSAKSVRPQLELMEAAPEAKPRKGIDGALTELVAEAAYAAADRVVENRIDGAYIDDEHIRTC